MNNGETHQSFLETGVACHHGCVLEEMRALKAEIDRLEGLIVARHLAEKAWFACSNDENGERLLETDKALEVDGERIDKKREGR